MKPQVAITFTDVCHGHFLFFFSLTPFFLLGGGGVWEYLCESLLQQGPALRGVQFASDLNMMLGLPFTGTTEVVLNQLCREPDV